MQEVKTSAAGRVQLRILAIPLLYIVCRMWGTLQFIFSLAIGNAIHNGCISSSIHWAFRVFGYFQVTLGRSVLTSCSSIERNVLWFEVDLGLKNYMCNHIWEKIQHFADSAKIVFLLI